MTLTEFMLARIAEDERLWSDGPDVADLVLRWKHPEREVAPTVVKVGRARALAECDTKRRIIDFALGELDSREDNFVLQLLALPYADHPDYQQEWK